MQSSGIGKAGDYAVSQTTSIQQRLDVCPCGEPDFGLMLTCKGCKGRFHADCGQLAPGDSFVGGLSADFGAA